MNAGMGAVVLTMEDRRTLNSGLSRILSDFQGTCPKGTVCLSLAVPFFVYILFFLYIYSV